MITVNKKNRWLPVGTELKPTGRKNMAGESEYVRVGHAAERGYQKTEEGQLIWVLDAGLPLLTQTGGR